MASPVFTLAIADLSEQVSDVPGSALVSTVMTAAWAVETARPELMAKVNGAGWVYLRPGIKCPSMV